MGCAAALQLLAQGLDPLGQPAGGLVVLDASFEDGVFFFVFLGELVRRGELRFRRRQIFRGDDRGPRA